MAKVFLSRKQRAPLRFASPVSDLGAAVEFRGALFWLVWGGWGGPCGVRRGEKGEVKELHSCEQVQSWAKLRMMDWALSGLQLVLGGNKWSGSHAEYTTLARETPIVEHLGNLFGKKWHANCWIAIKRSSPKIPFMPELTIMQNLAQLLDAGYTFQLHKFRGAAT